MYNRRDNALMQYKSYDQALNGNFHTQSKVYIINNFFNDFCFLFLIAVTKMDKVKLFDKVVSVGLSKFPEIQIPLKNVNLYS